MQIKVKKGEKNQLSPHLSQDADHVDCRCTYTDCTDTLVDTQAIALFELVRDVAQAPVTINRWYSCARHNKDIGGEPNSQHLIGMGFDCTPAKGRWTPSQAAAIRYKMKGYGGLGTYTDVSGQIVWLHIDAGPERNWTKKV